ncbi:MAG TPA: hypothetical protein VFX76_18370, partial [Roseiflexaceae bacterium]|nr:hypothetical protein [Roseiflexaceae bacterium]
QIRWSFAGGTYAILAADQWVEPQSGRHRLQLVHQDGGGPYELELGDGANTAWYAVGKSYAPSLYLLSAPDEGPFQVRFPATPAEQVELRQARLQSGAWDLAAVYLRMAAAAQEIGTWGRQREVDGTIVSLLSFSGTSPLAAPLDAPETPLGAVTILLAIDESSGRLREVRELIGPPGGEQTTRTTWRLLGEEWLNDQTARVFDIAEAWNGIGAFWPRKSAADPTQPLAEKRLIAPLSLAIQWYWWPLWMPAQSPPGAHTALLLQNNTTPLRSDAASPDELLTFVYMGEGRRLELRTSFGELAPLASASGWETSTINGNRLLLRAGPAQSYQARIEHASRFGEAFVTVVAARGYTRAELLAFLATLGRATIQRYISQAPLFADAFAHGDARASLLELLAREMPQSGKIRHTVARVFARQSKAPDPLPDPYHRPLYDGMPEQALQENWVRGLSNEEWQLSSTLRDEAGTLLQQEHADASQNWSYSAPLAQVSISANAPIEGLVYKSQPLAAILHMLGCGQATLLKRADGGSTISLSDADWRAYSCQHPHYPDLLQAQISGFPEWGIGRAPFLADITAAQLTTWIDTDAQGRLERIEVRAGITRDTEVLESWVVERDDVVSPEIEAATFAMSPPDAPVRWHNTVGVQYVDPTLRTITLGEALAESQTPLFGLPTTPTSPSATLSNTLFLTATLRSVEAGLPNRDGPESFNFDTVPAHALQHGYATRLTYDVALQDDSTEVVLYEGPANVFGPYLRATARWQSSTPTVLRVGERDVPAWQVAGMQGGRWTLFEVDGTLIALELPFERADAAAALLEPLAR